MTHTHKSLILILALVTLGGACSKKKVATATPPAPPAPPVVATTPAPPPAPTRTQTPAPVAQTPAPRPTTPDAATRARIDELLARIEDAYFNYNEASLRPDAVKALESNSRELRDILKDYPTYKLTIEGHADERGSAEYNLALAEKRAEAAKEYLVKVGIPSDQLGIVSYGKEKPVCTESDEACWQKNRRIHIVPNSKTN